MLRYKQMAKRIAIISFIRLRNIIMIITMAMKRIEAFIASEKTPYVLSAIENLGLQATFYESKGMGKGEKYTVSSGKGSGTQKMAYSTRTIVISIVDENKVEEAVSVIKEAAKTGTASGGIVAVTSVDDLTLI
jgi:nitrogen regulatory protein PII